MNRLDELVDAVPEPIVWFKGVNWSNYFWYLLTPLLLCLFTLFIAKISYINRIKMEQRNNKLFKKNNL